MMFLLKDRKQKITYLLRVQEILENKYACTAVEEACLIFGIYFYNTKVKAYVI